MSYIDEVKTIKEWKEWQLLNILKQRHGNRVLVFKNKKEKIKICLSPVNFEPMFDTFYKGMFYDIDELEDSNCYAIGLSWM